MMAECILIQTANQQKVMISSRGIISALQVIFLFFNKKMF